MSKLGFVCSSGEKPIFNLVAEVLSMENAHAGMFWDLLMQLMANIQFEQKEIDHLERQIKNMQIRMGVASAYKKLMEWVRLLRAQL